MTVSIKVNVKHHNTIFLNINSGFCIADLDPPPPYITHRNVSPCPPPSKVCYFNSYLTPYSVVKKKMLFGKNGKYFA